MIPYINIHTHTKQNTDSIELYNLKITDACTMDYNSFGLHPWELGKVSAPEYMEKLLIYATHKSIKAVGEIGLDKAIEYPLDAQEDWFVKQHTLAEKYQLPVIIHAVKAYNELLLLHKKLKPGVPWIFHGFTGSKELANQLINIDAYLSFGQQLLKSEKVQEVFKDIPLDNVFFETDNSDEKIENIYQKAADLRHICTQSLKEHIYRNFRSIF